MLRRNLRARGIRTDQADIPQVVIGRPDEIRWFLEGNELDRHGELLGNCASQIGAIPPDHPMPKALSATGSSID
jgi:hypothetical protein